MPLDAEHRWRIVQRRKRSQFLELADQRVVDECRPVEIRPAVHHPVPDRDQPDRLQVRTRLVEQLECGAQGRLMVGDPIAAGHLLLTESQARRRRVLADPLDDAVGQ